MFNLLRLFSVVPLMFAVNVELFDKHKVAETTNGKIRGILNTTLLNDIPFYAFKGIPYAKAPLGPLRFKPPEPADSWKPAILDAYEFGNICMQGQSPFLSTLPASEDCLTLNVFVSADIPLGCKLSVLIFIHGGLFKSGSGDDFLYGPDFIVEKQTILVTLNYRLGALGFLALDSRDVSGNMGLKDQQMALKWIYLNIGGFGGDNKRITMIGQSVGGVSATYHVLTAESRKYIRNSIPMSGSTGNVWAMAKEKNNLKLAYRMAKEIGGKELNSYDELIAFFKQVPAEKLIPYNGDFSPNNDLVEIVFGPVVERRDAYRPFLLDYPEKLYESTEIDSDTNFLFTICEEESLSVLPKRTPEFFAKLNANFSDHVRLPFRGLNIDYKSECIHAAEWIHGMVSLNEYFALSACEHQYVRTFYTYMHKQQQQRSHYNSHGSAYTNKDICCRCCRACYNGYCCCCCSCERTYRCSQALNAKHSFSETIPWIHSAA